MHSQLRALCDLFGAAPTSTSKFDSQLTRWHLDSSILHHKPLFFHHFL